MLTYFIMFLFPAFLALKNIQVGTGVWIFFGFIFSLLIGFRFEVGGDWVHYIDHLNRMQYENLETIITGEDPGYYLLNFLMYELDFGIGGVNFICGILFMTGLIKFAKQEYNPWMVIAAAVPYTIIVVSMGYTRQGVALGLVLWAITYLRINKMIGFFIFVTLAATFHKSAVLIIGLGIFAGEGSKLLKIIAVALIGFGVYDAFLSQYQDRLIKNYVDAQMQSDGAKIRTLMNFIPSILLIIYRKRWKEFFDDYTFWFIIALLSVFTFSIVGFASTAVDRVALYLIPIQLVVFARLAILMSHQISMQVVNIAILAYYFLVLFVYLNFANFSYAWLPYQSILLQDLF